MTEELQPAETAETGAAAPETTSLEAALTPAAPDPAPKPEKPAKAEAAPKADDPKDRNREGYGVRTALKAAEREKADLQRRIEALEREREQPRQEPRPAPNFSDPEQVAAYLEERDLSNRLDYSEDRFVDKHGQEALEDLKAWMLGKHDLAGIAVRQRDPWRYVFDIYRRERIADEIGDDPEAWRERQRQEIRAQMEAEFAEGQGYQPQPGISAPRLPTPAAGARSASPKGGFNGPTPLAAALKR